MATAHNESELIEIASRGHRISCTHRTAKTLLGKFAQATLPDPELDFCLKAQLNSHLDLTKVDFGAGNQPDPFIASLYSGQK